MSRIRFGIRIPVPGPFYCYIPLGRRNYGRPCQAPSQRWSLFGIFITIILWTAILPYVLSAALFYEIFVLLVLLVPWLLAVAMNDVHLTRQGSGRRFALNHRNAWTHFPIVGKHLTKGNS